MTTLEEAVEAVKSMRHSQFGLTSIKLECEANLDRGETLYHSETECHDFIMEALEPYGLSEYREEQWLKLGHGIETRWHPIGPLRYLEFYDDGSVDSEVTATVDIESEEDVIHLVNIAKVFKAFCETVEDEGGCFDIGGAGMHIALLNDPNCVYPSRRVSNRELVCFDNFRRSMSLMLPALYFLGTPNHRTRHLEYREPRIETYNGDSSWSERRSYKWCAITYNQGAVEFRVFDTCYDNLENILNNIIVMKNCMRYWRVTYKPSGLEKITSHVQFGNDGSYDLERFYVSTNHVDLLNAGLRKLKPNTLTIRDAKAQRLFTVTKSKLNTQLNQYRKDLVGQYTEYEERFKWQVMYKRHNFESDLLRRAANVADSTAHVPTNQEEVLADVTTQGQAYATKEEQNKLSADLFIANKLKDFLSNQGNFELGRL